MQKPYFRSVNSAFCIFNCTDIFHGALPQADRLIVYPYNFLQNDNELHQITGCTAAC